MPTPEARHKRANRICVEAIRIARRDGLTFAERIRIYERELARLMAEEPAYQPASTAPARPNFTLFRS